MKDFIRFVSGVLILLSVAFYPQETQAQLDIFLPKDTACHSPHGRVWSDCKASSPDRTRYAQEVDKNQGQIGIFDSKKNQRLKTIDLEEKGNDLKGLAWAPDSRQLAIMYHHDEDPSTPKVCRRCGYVAIVDAQSGAILKRVNIGKWHHYLAFDQEGRRLALSTWEGEIEEAIDLQ